MNEIVKIECKDNYSIIAMDDGRANAFSFEMIKQLNAAFDYAFARNAPVILTGREGIFCAGFDLNVMKSNDEALRNQLLDQGFSFVYRLMDSPVPVIVANTGHAIAMGAVLLLAADYRLSEDGAFKIGLNETAIGVVMPEFGIDLVKERVALSHQVPSLANSRLYDPQTAIQAGYLDEVVPSVSDAGEKMAELLSSINMDVHRHAKRALRSSFLVKHKAKYSGG